MNWSPRPAALTLSLLLSACHSEPAPPERPTLTIHGMSRCPFYAEAMAELLPVLSALEDRVDVQLGFLAQRDAAGWRSMYGARDLHDDRVQLCALARGGARAWRALLSCQLEDPDAAPDRWRACARRAGLDAAAVASCAAGPEGQRMLQDALARSEVAQVDESPTLEVNGARYTRGRHAWHYADALCAAFGSDAPAYCATPRAPVRVEVTIVRDRRCSARSCDTTRLERFAEQNLPGARLRTVDWQSPQAKALFQRSGARHLPVAIFSATLTDEPRALAALRRAGLTPLADGAGFALPVGTTWRPDPS